MGVNVFVDTRLTVGMLLKSLFLWAGLVVSLFFAPMLCHGGELILPSQTLRGPRQIPAKLTVLSEPPGLKVFLDGSEIGKTPVRRRQVKAGSYTLRVKDLETEIEAEAGEELKISLFKGSFIPIPETERAAEKRPGLEQEEIETQSLPGNSGREISRPGSASLMGSLGTSEVCHRKEEIGPFSSLVRSAFFTTWSAI